MVSPSAATLRVYLLVTLLLGMVGTGAELAMLGHTEDLWQWVPLVIMGVAIPVTALFWVRPGGGITLLFRILMAGTVLSGGVGVLLHYRGNVEFELEMTPSLGGWPLIREALTGATPALAPGALMVLGLVGLACSASSVDPKRSTHLT